MRRIALHIHRVIDDVLSVGSCIPVPALRRDLDYCGVELMPLRVSSAHEVEYEVLNVDDRSGRLGEPS
jgi:hypothetical protein